MNIIRGKQLARAMKFVIYGEPGVGKSTLASEFPKPIIGDAEEGTAHLDIDRVALKSWDEILAFADWAITDAASAYQTVIFDTADWIARYCEKSVLDTAGKRSIEAFGHGKGYVLLAETFSALIAKCTKIAEAGKHVVFLAHNVLKKVELPDETGQFDRHELKCPNKITQLLYEWADNILFMARETMVEKSDSGRYKATGSKRRRIQTSDNAICIAKNRLELPDVIYYELGHAMEALKITPPPPPIDGIAELRKQMEKDGVSEDDILSFLRGANRWAREFLKEDDTLSNLQNSIALRLADSMRAEENYIINNTK